MGNFVSYLKEFGNISFQEMPLNDVDSLLLCQLSYLKFDGIVPQAAEGVTSVSLRQIEKAQAYSHLFDDKRYEKMNRKLVRGMLAGKRYRNLRLTCYVNRVEKELEMQFSAVTFLLENGAVYVAFRGTDESLVGWKEDFNMAYLSQLPGQKKSVEYLNLIAERFSGPLFIGGHSKGGNLAIYSAVHCNCEVQDRIVRIYSMDGPGLRPEQMGQGRYDEIKDKILKVLPEESLIGMLFESGGDYMVVESSSHGITQHDPFTWKIQGQSFQKAKCVLKQSMRWNRFLNEWLRSLDKRQARVCIDTIYQVLVASKSDTLDDFAVGRREKLRRIRKELHNVDKNAAREIRQVCWSLVELFGVKAKHKLIGTIEKMML